jgi:hypothetical protein
VRAAKGLEVQLATDNRVIARVPGSGVVQEQRIDTDVLPGLADKVEYFSAALPSSLAI